MEVFKVLAKSLANDIIVINNISKKYIELFDKFNSELDEAQIRFNTEVNKLRIHYITKDESDDIKV